ncbi:MAG: FGGY-family carbohydrate kinase [Candidatus Thorarchaeota archaeon]
MTKKEGYIIAHDFGTSGDKAVLTDLSGNVLASDYREYPLLYPKSHWVEQNPKDWWKAFCATTQAVAKKAKSPDDILAIAPSAQMITIMPVNKNGNPLRNSISWLDLRATKQGDWLQQFSDEIYPILGMAPSAKDIVSRILWIKEEEPKIYSQTHKFLDCKDYLELKLTGNYVTDWSNASLYGIFDIRNHKWSERVCEVTGISPEKLPDAYPSTEIIGEVTSEAAHQIGVPAGTPVIATGGDVAVAAIGSGSVNNGDSHVCIGTATWIGVTTKEVIIDPQQRYLTMCSGDPDKNILMGEMETGGAALRWLRDTLTNFLNLPDTKTLSYSKLDSLAAKIPPGSDQLIFTPWMSGERSPLNDHTARGTYLGLKLGHTPGHLIRAILEGVAFNIRWILDSVEETAPFRINDICGVGGGAASKLWMQIISNVTGRAIRLVKDPMNAGSTGAALTAAVALGVYPDFESLLDVIPIKTCLECDQAAHDRYAQLFPIFKEAYQQLSPIFKNLAKLEGH